MATVRHRLIKIKKRTRKINILDIECVETRKGNICAATVMPHKFKTLKTRDYNPSKKTLKKKLYHTTMQQKIEVKKSIKEHKKSLKKRKNPPKKIEEKTKKSSQDITIDNKMSTKIKIRRTRAVKVAKPLNDKLISLLGHLEDLMKMDGEIFRARAYHNAAESIMKYPKPIYDVNVLKGYEGIGSTILSKFNEYVTTGTLQKLEKAKGKPVYKLVQVYGIGPKRARALVKKDGVTSLQELRKRQDELLNATQRKGLRYYDDILKRIPRAEIDTYKTTFAKVFESIPHTNSRFEIVGSYRRGAKTSGDIDVIITNSNNKTDIFKRFIAALQTKGIIIEILSSGRIKSFVIGQLPGKPARRLDFMYSPPSEFAFAILYFTGSKAFNVMQRERAVSLGYTMNEHALYHLIGEGKKKKKGKPVNHSFPDERSIFDFLGLIYKTPEERKNGKDVVVLSKTSDTPSSSKMPPKKPLKMKQKINISNPHGTIRIKSISTNVKMSKSKKTPKKRKKTARKRWKEVATGGMTEIKKISEQDLCDMVQAARKAYYNKKAYVTDEVFDLVKEYAERTFPTNLCWEEIGAAPEKQKVDLPYFMGSMDKIKPDTKALTKWKKKYGADSKSKVVISGKLDGISALYTTEGSEPKLYTRGRATKGLDISYLIPYLQLPAKKGIAIRGELLVALKTFNAKWKGAKANGLYKNPRNFVGGLAKHPQDARKRPEPKKWTDVDFVGYEVIKPSLTPGAQLAWLEAHKVMTVIHKKMATKDMTNEILSELLVNWRSSYKYEIDGIVVVDDKIWPRKAENPKHAFAFKMVLGDQMAEAKVVDIIWTASKDGYLKPVVQIEPVHIRGADIEFATAYNAKFVEDNKLGIGAIILLIRSGDVIPKIEKVIKPAEQAKMPMQPWKWNDTHVDAILLDVANNEKVRSKAIEYFFKKLDVAALGPGNVARIIQSGNNTIPKILKMTAKDFLDVPGFKQLTADKIYKSIHTKIEEAPLPRLMAATNIFGRGLGKTISGYILDAYPHVLTSSESLEEKEKKVANIQGLGKKRAHMFITHIQEFLDFITETGLKHKLIHTKKATDEGHPLFKKKIVMSGFRDASLQAKIEAKTSIPMATQVNKQTFLLIAKADGRNSGKYRKAQKLGIMVMIPAEFTKKYM